MGREWQLKDSLDQIGLCACLLGVRDVAAEMSGSHQCWVLSVERRLFKRHFKNELSLLGPQGPTLNGLKCFPFAQGIFHFSPYLQLSVDFHALKTSQRKLLKLQCQV